MTRSVADIARAHSQALSRAESFGEAARDYQGRHADAAAEANSLGLELAEALRLLEPHEVYYDYGRAYLKLQGGSILPVRVVYAEEYEQRVRKAEESAPAVAQGADAAEHPELAAVAAGGTL